ncbi:hypothetical protein HAX54_036403 [Datura stramonium]|uniref:Uncharacterized protein n=1 Tax=Datura stramonium TaxID=4076 RepID=A0ABS8VJK8_DATST|nr:hypothetical protein [Datura stramonium]
MAQGHPWKYKVKLGIEDPRASGIGDLSGPRLVVKQFIHAPNVPSPLVQSPISCAQGNGTLNTDYAGENRANVFNGNQLTAEGVNSPCVEGRDQNGASMYRGCSGVKC